MHVVQAVFLYVQTFGGLVMAILARSRAASELDIKTKGSTAISRTAKKPRLAVR